MNLTLKRMQKLDDGIFSDLSDSDGSFMAVTLEHSYDKKPKIPNGVYDCVRGMHQLEHMTEPFETFEITGVPGHSNILFHVGNFNADSEGCVLLGVQVILSTKGHMISSSKEAFERFMRRQEGCDKFTLSVITPGSDPYAA